MLFCGSRNKTAAEMRSVLGYDHASLEDGNISAAFGKLVSSFEKSSVGCVLAMANSLMSQEDFKVKEDYKSILTKSFQATLFEVNFQKETEKVLNLINGWAKEKTNGKITSMLDTIRTSTVLILLNAVYFKGKWQHKFQEKRTYLQRFYNNGIENQAKQVHMMHLRESFPYVEKETFQALQLPYKGGEISMMVLLPNSRNGIEDLESKLTPSLLQSLKQRMCDTEVDVALPKFKFEYSKDLKEYFKRLGLSETFQIGADFGGINESKQLVLSEVVHKAVLEINEEGSEAAAVTRHDVDQVCDFMCPQFIVDHPFLFVIHNVRNNIILFMGRVNELGRQISQEDLVVTEANNYLAVNLYRLLANEKQNVFFSPISVSAAMAMLFCGAKNETAAEMRSVLGYEHANIEDETISTLLSNILSSIEDGSEHYTLTMANCLLSNSDFKVKNEFKSLLCNSFKAKIAEVDFQNEKEVLDEINRWVNEKTSGKISSLLDSLDPMTVMVLLNAVYFKGNWLHEFPKESTDLQCFYNHGEKNDAKEVNMMHLKAKFSYTENESYKALQLPYLGNEIAMVVLLPNAMDGLESLERELTPSMLNDLKRKMRSTKVEVALPKFKLEYLKPLTEYFQKLGLNKVFQCGADLGNINDSKNLLVSEIMHKAVLDVNEEGSEAAAVTAVVVVGYSLSFDPEFIADHPFIFVIYNTKTNLILFMGKVEEL
ncbi:intracellular coagulation inhibitor 2-like [Uloborus diversus]|uniref:intracellular coagulation inhibitor 2-like n=1 Tax=Uloborus diversus TaxID=327109 RepID=UPI0024095D71|nr:intracellular coagulation inhibitor 2-like [Uloborus diversus]